MENSEACPGDRVEIHLDREIYSGTLLESPGGERGIVLLKLDSGYNLGFRKKEVVEIRVIKKSEEVEQTFNIKKDSEKPNIAMIITGGTIAAKLNPKKGGVDWLTDPESLFKYYPEIFEIANVSKVVVPFMKASEDMDFRDWKKLAKIVVELVNDDSVRGVILTHGTDFLHYTSSVLSFFVRNLNKPVVLTYSQRSVDRASSDANLNLRCSALAAISDIAEVMIVGHASSNDDFCYAMPGTKVRKIHTSKRDAFKVVNSKPFAKIFSDSIKRVSSYKARGKGKAILDNGFEERVALVKVYPGQDPKILDFYLESGYKGLILELSGLGHAPTRRARKGWTKKLKEVQEKGMIICGTSQCIFGRTDPLVYSNGRELLNTGIIYLEDMLSETAFVKLGWVLSKTQNRERVRELMLKNFSKEISDRIEF